MLQILDLGRPDVFAYRASGVLTEEEIREAFEAFDGVTTGREVVHLYAEIEALRGAEVRALWLDMVYGLRRMGDLRRIGRVAVVTDATWVSRLAETEALLLPIGSLHTFDVSSRDDARSWIRDSPAVATLANRDQATPDGEDDWMGDEQAWFDERFWPQGATRQRRPHAPRFGHTLHGTHAMLRDVASRLGTEGTAPAYHALRTVLHALRDRLPAAEAADLAAQFPGLVRGVFYEGYRPARAMVKTGRDEFLDAVDREIHVRSPFGAEEATRAVAGALGALVSAGQWQHVLHALPEDIRELFEPSVAT